MKAEDTIIDDNQRGGLRLDTRGAKELYEEQRRQYWIKVGYEQSILDNDRWCSTTAAYKMGIKEVVDWINKVGINAYAPSKTRAIIGITIDTNILQAKLKEWGVE